MLVLCEPQSTGLFGDAFAIIKSKKSNGIIIECGPGKVLSGLAKANNIDNVYSTSSESFMDSLERLL